MSIEYIGLGKLYDNIFDTVLNRDPRNREPREWGYFFLTLRQPFLIIGATSMEQLKVNIGSVNLDLSAEILDQIERISALYPDPCP